MILFDQVVVFLTFRGVMRKSLISRFAKRENPVISRSWVSMVDEFVGVKKINLINYLRKLIGQLKPLEKSVAM
jgi:hypothetical protein